MNVAIRESGPPLLEMDLTNAERRMDRAIPQAYRDFLLHHNGGRPEPYAFKMQPRKEGPAERGCVNWLFGISVLRARLRAKNAEIRDHQDGLGNSPARARITTSSRSLRAVKATCCPVGVR